MSIKYCPLCDRVVEPTKKWSWGWFFLLFILGSLIWYPIYYVFFARKKFCPICGTKKLLKERPTTT
jgi:RNA polymerase subunit RPABC4/transcription elongation factor Spt4